MSRKFKYLLFDLDGTVIDSAPDIIISLKKAYKKISGYDGISIEKEVVGPQISEIITSLTPSISDDDKDTVIKLYRKYYDNCNFTNTRLMPNSLDVLDHFQEKGVEMFIVTNKPAMATMKIVEKLKIKKYFCNIVTPDILSEKKMTKVEMVNHLIRTKNLARKECLLIGDGVSDLKSANQNKINSVAILNGYDKEEDLKLYHPTFLAKEIGELPELNLV